MSETNATNGTISGSERVDRRFISLATVRRHNSVLRLFRSTCLERLRFPGSRRKRELLPIAGRTAVKHVALGDPRESDAQRKMELCLPRSPGAPSVGRESRRHGDRYPETETMSNTLQGERELMLGRRTAVGYCSSGDVLQILYGTMLQQPGAGLSGGGEADRRPQEPASVFRWLAPTQRNRRTCRARSTRECPSR